MIVLQYFIDQLFYYVHSQHVLTGWQSNTCLIHSLQMVIVLSTSNK